MKRFKELANDERTKKKFKFFSHIRIHEILRKYSQKFNNYEFKQQFFSGLNFGSAQKMKKTNDFSFHETYGKILISQKFSVVVGIFQKDLFGFGFGCIVIL